MYDTGDSPGAARTVPLNRVLLSCLAVLSVATAVIHFAVSGEHFQEYWLFGVFMLAVAWLQLLWAALAVARPSRLLLWTGIVLNAGVIIVYIVTRTAGDVIGPTPNDVEPAGFGDLLCTVLEAVIMAGCAWLGTARTGRQAARRQVPRGRLLAVPSVTAALIAVLLSVALVDGGPEMVMTAASGPSMSGSSMPGAPSVKLATTTPAGDITMPDTTMSMPGMRMASSKPCDAAPTTAQQQAAVKFVDSSWQDAKKYQSLAAAQAAGYVPITPSGARVVHYVNRAFYLATVRGGPVLDLADPQSLVYANTSHGAVLVAAMYITAPDGPTPQPGGCLTQWHVHTNLCLAAGRVVGVTGQRSATCPAGSSNRVTPAMMHVWYVPIPGGPTAIDATNAQVVQAAEQVSASG
ncbi:MAG TPA: hypothetical protein VGI21_23970 [Streptosporangiaceae bacterium]|jgi:hypothetical protein